MPHQNTWFCVADAGTARIIEFLTPRSPPRSITILRHAPYEHGRYEEPGKSQESATTARHSFTDAESPIRREKRHFAHTVADFLHEAAERAEYHRLVVAAPPKFLGDLRTALSVRVRKIVASEISKDLTKESAAELAVRMSEVVITR